jgi:hypothetical protein
MSQANNYETAICFFIPALNKTPLKYRNIKSRASLERFIQNKWPEVQYINYYNKVTKAFQGRTWLQ